MWETKGRLRKVDSQSSEPPLADLESGLKDSYHVMCKKLLLLFYFRLGNIITWFKNKINCQKVLIWDFPGGPVVKTSPSNVGVWVDPWSGS